MSHYIQLYKDAGYADLWRNVDTIPITYTSISQVKTITLNGKSYKYCDDTACLISGVPQIKARPLISWTDDDIPEMVLYLKNGLQINRVLKESTGVRFENYRYKDVSTFIMSSNNHMINDINQPSMWGIEFVVDNVVFLGFTKFLNTKNGWPGYIVPSCCFELAFWENALRPPYDYGTGTDADGGQGTGKIPHTDIPLTATPSKIVPIGGRGLHAYRINAQAYGSLQGYLWGDSSTLAKSLWQKFNNKTHNPVSCIVGCFSLPEDFMPTGTGNTGINLAGLYLSPISGTCVSVGGNIGFVDKTITFGAIEPPFHNFLDYTAITCKIHVPFCGEMAIAPEQIIGSDLTLRYRVDQLNGNIVAAVKANGIVLGELSGNCAYNIPLSGGDDGTLQRLGAITSGVTAVVQDNVQGAMVAMQNGMNAGFSAQLVNSDLHGSTTACENRVPYLVWTYSGTAYTPDYAQAQGVPCEFSGNLGAFSGGYGEFEIMSNSPALQLVYDIMGATETEKQEIAALLRNGVIV